MKYISYTVLFCFQICFASIVAKDFDLTVVIHLRAVLHLPKAPQAQVNHIDQWFSTPGLRKLSKGLQDYFK